MTDIRMPFAATFLPSRIPSLYAVVQVDMCQYVSRLHMCKSAYSHTMGVFIRVWEFHKRKGTITLCNPRDAWELRSSLLRIGQDSSHVYNLHIFFSPKPFQPYPNS